jgi:hypothetical protein
MCGGRWKLSMHWSGGWHPIPKGQDWVDREVKREDFVFSRYCQNHFASSLCKLSMSNTISEQMNLNIFRLISSTIKSPISPRFGPSHWHWRPGYFRTFYPAQASIIPLFIAHWRWHIHHNMSSIHTTSIFSPYSPPDVILKWKKHDICDSSF